ncbi:MAG TPA: PAS domain S-box protein [Acidimicrobiia bacterium]|nr:PAS domain S-box protein [Acidimicrobiia bacterium]
MHNRLHSSTTRSRREAIAGPTDERLVGLLDAAPDAMVAADADGFIVWVNAQTEMLFGYSREELLGTAVDTLVPEHLRTAHPEHRRRYLQDRRHRPMGAGVQLAARRKDGSEFPADISLSSVTTDEGTLVCAAIRDVTERVRADAKFHAFLDAAPDATIGVGRDGRIAIVNARAEQVFGYARTELLGAPVELLVPEHARDGHRRHRAHYFADPRDRPMGAGLDLAARRKDGSEFPAEISLATIDTDEGLLVCAAIRDVTDRIEAKAERERLRAEAERERLEGQVQRAQRLESLGELAGGVAHDFNNLLAAIINFASFAGEEVSVAASEPGGERWVAVLRDIEQVTRAAKRASQLTHQLLAFARREVVQPRVLNLNSVVAETEQLLRHTIGEHVDLATDLDPDLWPIVADPGRIEQVLVNLAVNARDAMLTGGMLRIDTGNVIADRDYALAHPGLAAGRYVRLRVSDSGTGMDAETQQHAFEPFFSTKPKGEGTGLVLATVYGIILQAGGRSTLYSEPGIGTTFSALLPATTGAATTTLHAVDPAPTARGGGETVLVTEDEDAIREVARRILTRNGYPVLLAENGARALEALDAFEGEVHLLLTDVVMPGMQGKELAEEALRHRPGLRVLYMSGYAQPILASQGTLDPGVVLLEKPFTEQSLLGRVREVLDS